MKIVVDTREQKPFVFRKSKTVEGVVRKKLDVGDYSIEGYEDKIAFERKSALDLCGTAGKGHARFKRELERSKKLEYFGIVVECPFSDMQDECFEGAHNTKMRGYVVNQICCTYMVKYGVHLQFCKDRKDAANFVRETFKAFLKKFEAEGKSGDNAKRKTTKRPVGNSIHIRNDEKK
jgi:ERCC4-type nuclease